VRRVLATICILSCVFTVACSRQEGYAHAGKELTAEDRRQIRIVEESPLGKLVLMREIVDGMVSGEEPLSECNYWVSKVIERERGIKDSKGLYPFHYSVTCFTFAGNDNPELEYVWEVDNSEFGIVSFRWGFTPNIDPDEQ
jgi:hypothetical protein